MAARSTDHPELGPEGNPLIEGLAPYVTLLPMAQLLQNEPLKQIRWQSLKPELREVHLKEIENHYWPVAPQERVELRLIFFGLLLVLAQVFRRRPLEVIDQGGFANELLVR